MNRVAPSSSPRTPSPCLLASLVLAMACSEGSIDDVDGLVTDAGVTQGRPVPAADFCSEMAAIVCRANVTCCGGVTGGEEGETCATQQLEACEGSVLPLLEDPRTGYVPERGGAYLDGLATKADGCFAEPPALDDLLVVFEGTGAVDADCTPADVNDAGELRVAQLSCGDGSTCHLYRRSDGSPLGVCEPREDAACSHRFDCSAGEWCSLPSDWEPGRWGDCRPLKADGWACSSDLECGSHYCERGTCAPPHEERYCAATTYRGAVLAHDPIGYWRLGDTDSGSARDEGVNAFDGSYVGAPSSTEGALGSEDDGAVALDGAEDAVVLPEIGDLIGRELSMELWFKRSAESTVGPLLEFNTGEEGGIGARLWSYNGADKVHANFMGEAGTSHSVTAPEGTIEADTWYHVVASYDGSGLRLYVNGNQVGDTLEGSWPTRLDGPLYIGIRAGDERHIDGAVDEVAVYDYALTRSQVRYHRDRAEGPARQDFVLLRWLR